jgi:hypothetical protein
MPPTSKHSQAASKYWLGHDVFLGDVGEGLIFLDLKRNRYLGLSEKEASLLGGLVEDWPTREVSATPPENICKAHEVATALLRGGLLSRRAPKTTREEPPATTEALRKIDLFKASGKIRAASCIRFMFAYFPCRILYRWCSLDSAVSYLRRRGGTINAGVGVGHERLVELMAQFMKLRALTYTARGSCLLDCLVLSEFLRLHGVRASFVLGVATRPFESHCWLQIGGMVINDTIERVSYFVPILAV